MTTLFTVEQSKKISKFMPPKDKDTLVENMVKDMMRDGMSEYRARAYLSKIGLGGSK
jgi:hypothetical protein